MGEIQQKLVEQWTKYQKLMNMCNHVEYQTKLTDRVGMAGQRKIPQTTKLIRKMKPQRFGPV